MDACVVVVVLLCCVCVCVCVCVVVVLWCVWCVWCVVQMIQSTACLSRRVPTMHLIGWQNTWEQAPGVPATPSPP